MLFLYGEVDHKTTAQVFKYIIEAKKAGIKRLDFFVNLEGGCVTQTREITKLLETCSIPTVAHTFGECCSAGTLIICSMDKVYSTSGCDFLVHYGEETITSPEERRRAALDLKWMKKQYAKKCKVSARSISKWLSGETYMNAERALKVGLIDEIKELNETWL